MIDLNNETIASNLIEAVGVDNILGITHCATRIRFILKDKNLVDDKKIDQIDGVKGTFYAKGQFQIFVDFKEVEKIYAAINEKLDVHQLSPEEVEKLESGENAVATIINRIKNVFKNQ